MPALQIAVYVNKSPWRYADVAVDRILPNAVMTNWPLLLPYLDLTPEMWQNGQTPETFRDELLRGTLQLWVLTKDNQVQVFAATQVRTFGPTPGVVVVWTAGKGLTKKGLFAFGLDCLHRFAAAQKATRVIIEGRRGWVRLAKRYGFEQPYVVLSAPVNRERMN